MLFSILQGVSAIAIIILVLLQMGGMGLGRGSSSSFTRRGAEKLIFKSTFVFVLLFLIISAINLFY